MTAPESPSFVNPGAKFTEDLYLSIAQLSNDDFVALRDEILIAAADSNADLKALQTSFYSNGCTDAPEWLTPQPTWEACVQHDFRYTVGANVFFGNGEKARADRSAADRQLGKNIGAGDDVMAKIASFSAMSLTQALGGWFYTPTPIRVEKTYASGHDICETLQNPYVSSRVRELFSKLA
ncbi:hypothetical protein AB0C81_18660 [Streptomyces roseoverticillatus]|uniref:hypothetical protein n=1 Tax=Streptomyces roseoverticillatus TaxID=66429 RepID=UPI00340116CE